jgi:HD-like signal output (HDOD) protein
VNTEEAFGLIDRIDHVMAGKYHDASLSPDVFKTLDDINASQRDIETVGLTIGSEVSLRLFAIANSAYYGSLRRGNIGSFYDVVNCLGTHQTKALIIALSNSSQGKQDQEVETIFARSYATSIMAMILAGQIGYREDAQKKAEMGGLFMECGRKMMILYKKMHAHDPDILNDEFIESYHPYLGEKIVRRYGLPDYIKTVILARNLIMEENNLSLAGVVHLAYDSVRESFRNNDNRLVIKCQIPRPATDVTRTIEAIVTEKFRAVGLEKYLHIIKIPRTYDY